MINIAKMQRKQQLLDDLIMIEKNIHISKGEMIKNLIFAISDEVLEVVDNRDDVTEYIDILHFTLSIANLYSIQLMFPEKHEGVEFEELIGFIDYDIKRIARETINFKHWSNKEFEEPDLEKLKLFLTRIVDDIYTACTFLGCSMVDEYNKKFAINVKRQFDGY